MTIPELYVSGKSIPEIARLERTNRSRVRMILLAAGVKLRTRAEGVRLSPLLGVAARGKTRQPFSRRWRSRISMARRKWAAKHAKGTSTKSSGYVEITRGPNKGRSVHAVKMEQHIERRLRKNEIVHHRGRRSDNRLTQLELMTRSEHARLHALERTHERDRAGRFKKGTN